MTVQDLINKLQEFDPALKVVLSGYEGGCYFLQNCNQVTVALDVNSPEDWWYGPHEVVNESCDWMHERTETHEKINAIYIT